MTWAVCPPGLYAGIKFFLIDFVFKRCPRLRAKYDTPYIVWKSLPTDPQLKERSSAAAVPRRVSPPPAGAGGGSRPCSASTLGPRGLPSPPFHGPWNQTAEEFSLLPGSVVLEGQPALGGAGCRWSPVLPGPRDPPTDFRGWAGPGPTGCGVLAMATESLGASGGGHPGSGHSGGGHTCAGLTGWCWVHISFIGHCVRSQPRCCPQGSDRWGSSGPSRTPGRSGRASWRRWHCVAESHA